MSTRSIGLTEGLWQYLVDVTVQEPPVLQKLRAETAALPGGEMQISPEQGRFMRFLVELMGVRRYLEVGVFTGYSSLSVALSLPDDGRIMACDVSEEWTAIARRYWKEAGVDHKVQLRIGPGKESLDILLKQGHGSTYDFAFFDADKESSLEYYELAIELVRPGGVIAFDNALWGGSVANASDQRAGTEAVRAVNARASTDSRVSAALLPIGDGLLLARKR
jgi:predicted O-methyltransferase YrrM